MTEQLGADAGVMTPYEREQWARLLEYWAARASGRGTPVWLADGARAVGDAAGRAGRAVSGAGRAVADVVPAQVKDVALATGAAVLDKALRPTVEGVLHVLGLVNDWAVELHDQDRVLAIARKRGLEVTEIADLRAVGLKDCDRLLTRQTLRWRTVGALEGGAMGALAMVPVAGLPLSVGADVVVVDVLSLSIATRIAYSYGFDAQDPAEREFIDTVIQTAVAWNLAKAAPLLPAHKAHGALRGRVRWSAKLREDHRLIAELEKFMARWYRGGRVPVQHVGKAVWGVGIVVGAGVNARTLGRVAEHARAYCQTRWLSERYGLPLPPALATIHPEGFGRLDARTD